MSMDVSDPATGKPRMCAEMCSTCILRPGSTVVASLPPGRVRELIADARRGEAYVICHSTLTDEPAICRGFADRYSTNSLRIMERLGGFVEIEPPSLAPKVSAS